ncbi:signal-transducing adaptor protein 1-like [Astatotilapia calliptera]|uniref:SH2 domain-containing protein n=1 Tax=Astatotilapia calliptera TaxID=8154 RepID=A0A3P8PVR3_ASTCA|nr:signal-transducing adaptor protein 1-like [Astatotilapia calliptera]
MSVPPRVVHKRRETITALPLYYSGHLLKKHSKDKDFKKYYGELRGCSLFLYKDDTQDTYTEKLDLEQLKSMESDSPYQKKEPTVFTLSLSTEKVQLKMDSADMGEVWRGFILTVVKKELPSKLQLMPGQVLQLKEVLTQEIKRKSPSSRPPLPPRPGFLSGPPSKDKLSSEIAECFFDVTRKEAEKMLEENPECGSIILRPSTMPNNYALTLRQVSSSGPVMKNYRVTQINAGFVIELETPVTVSSLKDVLKYFIEKTEYRLCPFIPSQPYDTLIEASPAPKCLNTTARAPKPLPKAQVPPMLRSRTKEEILPNKPDEGEYVIPDDPNDSSLNLAQLDDELRRALKQRRENIYVSTDEKVSPYETKLNGKTTI